MRARQAPPPSTEVGVLYVPVLFYPEPNGIMEHLRLLLAGLDRSQYRAPPRHAPTTVPRPRRWPLGPACPPWTSAPIAR